MLNKDQKQMRCLQKEINPIYVNLELCSPQVVIDMQTLRKFCPQFLEAFYG